MKQTSKIDSKSWLKVYYIVIIFDSQSPFDLITEEKQNAGYSAEWASGKKVVVIIVPFGSNLDSGNKIGFKLMVTYNYW